MPQVTDQERSLPERLTRGLASADLPGLAGIRAIAAFLVVFDHTEIVPGLGGLGVLMFFVLSGFLITWLLLKEHEKYGAVSLRRFYARRTLRIFPAFYVYAAVLLAFLAVRHKNIVWPQAIASLFYVNNYYQAVHGDPNTGLSHTWSLGVEEQYYLLWPVAALAMGFHHRKLVQALGFAIGAVWIYRILLIVVLRVDQGYIYEAFDTRIDHLLIGCLLAVVLRAGYAATFWRNVATSGWTALVAGLLTASAVLEHFYGSGYRDAIGFIVNPMLIAIWIAQMIALRAVAPWGALNWPWVQYLGRISYSLYLYQQLFGGIGKSFLRGWPFAAQAAASVILIVIAASGSYYFIEQPFLRLKERFRPARLARHEAISDPRLG